MKQVIAILLVLVMILSVFPICTMADNELPEVQQTVEQDAPHEHSYEAIVTEPSCTEAGYITYTCSCGNSYTEAGEAALGHNYVPETIAPTCTEEGYTIFTCSRCGESYTDDYTDAFGHVAEEVAEIPATTEGPGKSAGTVCKVCGTILAGCEEIPPIETEYIAQEEMAEAENTPAASPEAGIGESEVSELPHDDTAEPTEELTGEETEEPAEETPENPETVQGEATEETSGEVQTEPAEETQESEPGNAEDTEEKNAAATGTEEKETELSASETAEEAKKLQGSGNDGASAEAMFAAEEQYSLPMSNEELFEGYVTMLFEGREAMQAAVPEQILSEPYLSIEKRMKALIKEVAEGNRQSTEFVVDYADLAAQYSVDYSNMAEHRMEIAEALSRDCTYELYWWDEKTDLHITNYSISWKFEVAQDYRSGSELYTVNSSKINQAKTAVANANAIISRFSSYSDRNKLKAYYDEIHNLCDYDYEAYDRAYAGETPSSVGSNPWNLIYVFDGNQETKVICTGFARAFEYLCNHSNFSGNVNCICAYGTMNGSHAWNVVSLGGENLIVDLTIGCFLIKAVLGSVDAGYTIEDGGSSGDRTYRYDEQTKRVFPSAMLEIAPLDWTLNNGVLTVAFSGDLTYRFANSPFAKMNVKKIIIKPGNTQIIGSNAFYGCSAIEEVVLPTGITTIMDHAFYGCSSLKKITIPAGVTSIEDQAFLNCTALTSVTIPAGVTELGEYSFYGCSSLKEVRLPKSLVSIGYAAFNKCDSVTDVYYPGTKSQWNAIAVAEGNGCLLQARIHYGWMAAPVLTEAFNSATGVRVSWTAETGAVKFRLLRKNVTLGETQWKNVGETAERSLIDKTAVSSNRYTYTVECINSDGSTASARDETGRTCTYIAKADVTTLRAGEKGVSISWSKPAGAKNFRVMRRPDGTNNWTVIAVVEGTSYTDTAAPKGVKLWYTVRGVSMDNKVLINSYNGTGWSLYHVNPPVMTEAFNSATGVRVSWNPVTGAAKYRLLRKNLTQGETQWKEVGTTADSSMIDKTAVSSNRYSYTVECIDGNGRTSSAQNATGRTCTYIAMAKITEIKGVTNGVSLTWSKPAGAKNFRVFRKVDGSGTWTAIKDIQGTTWTDTSAQKNVKYWYTVRAITLAGDMYINSYNATGWSVMRK